MGYSLRQTDNIQSGILLATTALTTAITTTGNIYVGGANQINLYLNYTKGSSFAINLRLDFGATKTFLCQEVIASTVTVTGITTQRLNIRRIIGPVGPIRIIAPVSDRWFRMRYQAVSTGGNAKLYAQYSLGYI